MKKLLTIVMVILFTISLSGCASDLVHNGKVYESYGPLNLSEVKDNQVEYELCWGNLIWGVLLIETIVAPVYFFGFSLYEPVDVI